MNEFKKSLAVASSAGPMLGLSIAIPLLTQTGRYYAEHYGWLSVLGFACAIFLILELVVVLVANRMQRHYFGVSTSMVRSSSRPRN